MESWVLERLQEFVGRNDREALAALPVEDALAFQSMGDKASYRVRHALPVLGRGLVVTEEGVVPDYARVRRVFHLTNAITKYYYSPFYLEPQTPGFHARVARFDGQQVGLTRDGRYCAFTTDRARDWIPDAFFDDHPELIVCLAVEGRGIPYAKPSYRGDRDDVVAWGTEILERNVREPISTADKYRLFEQYDIRFADHVGPYDAGDVDEIVEWMKEFEASGGTGIILKPSERHHRPLKYSLPSALERATPAWLGLAHEIQEDAHFERLLQAACAAVEIGRPADQWDWAAVGKSLLEPLARAAQEIGEGGSMTEEYSVWLHDKEAATLLIEQLEERTAGASIHQLALDPEDDGWRLRFERRFGEATAALERRLSGASYRD